MIVSEDFLKKTKYCDCENPAIIGLARSLVSPSAPDKENAVKLFYWVRDNVFYQVGFWRKKASETLLERKGVCTCKANLLVALLRASGIPAGYGVMQVDGREYFGPIVPDFLKNRISRASIHIYACAYLSGQWIKCDPSDDKEFSEKTSYFNYTSKLVDWDGEHDAPLNLRKEHILKDECPIADIDHIINKKPKTATTVMVKMGNFYIDFLRSNNQKINHCEQLEPLFRAWIKQNHPFFYLLFLSLSSYYGFAERLKFVKY